MGFFDTVRRVLHRDNHPVKSGDVARAWGLDETDLNESSQSASGDPGRYDREQWQRKMKRILAELPDSRGEWDELMADARSLKLDAEWVKRFEVEEFEFLVRRAVSDRHFSEKEHRVLDMARDLIGLPEQQAEAILHKIVDEAEAFFGGSVEDKNAKP